VVKRCATGKYGGRGAPTPGRSTRRTAIAAQNDKLLYWDYTGTKLESQHRAA
jgi:hypothetical protein